MAEGQAPWPTEPGGPTPWIFSPKGFLVVILVDAGGAERARDELVRHGFATDDLRVYTCKQILDNHADHRAQRGVAKRFVRAATTDPEVTKLYYDYARDGRSALWVRVTERAKASKGMAALADHDVLHFHYYDISGDQEDIHIR